MVQPVAIRRNVGFHVFNVRLLIGLDKLEERMAQAASAEFQRAAIRAEAMVGIHKVVRDIDLALHLPLRYEDETQLAPIASLRDGDTAQVEGTVRDSQVQFRPRRQLVVRLVDDAGDELVLRFLHFYPSHQKALAVGQRLRVRGEARGVKVIDDFGHHPTAIAQTLQALRHRFAGHRLWAIFEPRSNTTRRAVFQRQLPEALQLADGVFIAQVAKLEQIPEEERLKPEAVVDAIANSGRPAFYEENADAIVDRIVPMLRPKDVVVVFSNGGFDNIHEKLLKKLQD